MSVDPGPAGLGPDDRVRSVPFFLGALVVLVGFGGLVAAAAGPVLGYLSLDCAPSDPAGPLLCRPGVVAVLGVFAWVGWWVAVVSMVTAAVAARRGRRSTPWVVASWTTALATLFVLVLAGLQR